MADIRIILSKDNTDEDIKNIIYEAIKNAGYDNIILIQNIGKRCETIFQFCKDDTNKYPIIRTQLGTPKITIIINKF